MNIRKIFLLIFFLSFSISSAHKVDDKKKDFQFLYKLPTDQTLSVSKLYELDIDDSANSENNISIYNSGEKVFVPVQLVKKPVERPVSYRLTESLPFQNIKDENGNFKNITFTSDLDKDIKEKESVLEIFFDRPVKSNSLTFTTTNNGEFPKLVKVLGKSSVILNATPASGGAVSFADTESDYFKIIFTHTNPLRLGNISLSNNYNDTYYDKYLTFLATPHSQYLAYTTPQDYIQNTFVGNYNDPNPKFINLSKLVKENNPAFEQVSKIKDFDEDGVPDEKDNCPYTKNEDQKDENSNFKGDACDDFDYDGVINTKDNCINTPNIDQKDSDHDNMGDVCDTNGESRWTEHYKWLQYAGLAFLLVIVIFLFAFTANIQKR